MARRSNLSTFLGIIVLVIGVAAGVLLVSQVQDFRNRAKEKEKNMYDICHKTLNPDKPWEQMTVKPENLEEHLNHGDILGECPEEVRRN